ncbi:phage-related minor tail protein [Evansella vedderi]|uniref:Phage-related minor tail protein n=1 Tax=Evansella vedderi TaxID=38282 RepID=A0ABT9ZUL2_9BACI|nr:hypothetical protein [Evansella vedderi]MDQ0254932.1 phage-related minor tail protein [Evansella vedderi]
MEIFRLFGSIFIEDNDVEKKVDDVGKKAESAGEKVKKMGDNVSKAGGFMTKWVTGPIAAAGAGIVALTGRITAKGDEIAKTSRQLNISTDAYQELEYALGQLGVSQGGFERGLRNLNDTIGQAANGSEKHKEQLEKLGVNMEALENGTLSTDEAFMQVMGTLHGMDNASQASALAAELFGSKVGPELATAIEEGDMSIQELRDHAHDLGIVMSEDATKASEEYQDAIDDLTRTFGGFFQELVTGAVPFLTETAIPFIRDQAIPAIQDFSQRIGELIQWFMDLSPETKKVIGIITMLAFVMGPILMIVGKAISLFMALLPVLKLVGVGIGMLFSPIGLIIAAIAALIAIGVLLWKNWDIIREKASEIFNKVVSVISDAIDGAKNAISDGMQAALTIITNLGSSFFKAGRGLIDQVVSGITGAIGKVKDAASNLAGTVRNLLPFSPAKEGPLSDLDKLDFAGPVEESIDDGIDDVHKKMSHMLTVPELDEPETETVSSRPVTRNDYSTLEALLLQLIQAVKDGKIIVMDDREVGRVVEPHVTEFQERNTNRGESFA